MDLAAKTQEVMVKWDRDEEKGRTGGEGTSGKQLNLILQS